MIYTIYMWFHFRSSILDFLRAPKLFSYLGESSGSVALVRLDNIAALNLLVGVGRPDDLAGLVVDNGKGGEAIALTELAAPAGGDGVPTAGDRATIGVRGSVALHNVVARGSSAGAGVDAEVPCAGSVLGVAGALHVLNGPLGTGGHHGNAGSRGGHDRRGEEAGSDEKLSELHGCGCVGYRRNRKV